jgi:hypothetical protein
MTYERAPERARTETTPPQNEVSGGPDTPLELTKTGWRNTGLAVLVGAEINAELEREAAA